MLPVVGVFVVQTARQSTINVVRQFIQSMYYKSKVFKTHKAQMEEIPAICTDPGDALHGDKASSVMKLFGKNMTSHRLKTECLGHIQIFFSFPAYVLRFTAPSLFETLPNSKKGQNIRLSKKCLGRWRKVFSKYNYYKSDKIRQGTVIV